MRKVGVKTAAKLVHEFGHLEEIIAGLNKGKAEGRGEECHRRRRHGPALTELVTLHEGVPMDIAVTTSPTARPI